MTDVSATPIVPDGTVRPRVGPSAGPGSLRNAASIVFFGNLAWLGWLWGVLLVLLPVVLLVIDAAGGHLEGSLWAEAGFGWQRWVVFAAGVQTTATFLRMFVTRGVTRRRLGQASLLAMVAITALGVSVGVVGYLVERWFFRGNGWPHVLNEFGPIAMGDLWRLALEHVVIMVTYYLSGWLVGAAFVRFGAPLAVPLIVPALVPVGIVELAMSRLAGGANIEVLPEMIQDPSLGVSLGIGSAVIALVAVAVTRWTRELPVR